jgi:general secretion pathway protein C
MALEWKNVVTLVTHPAMGRAVTLVNLLLLTMVAHTVAQVTWHVLPALPAVPAPFTAGGDQPGTATTTDRGAMQQIAAWHLFGNAAKAPVQDLPPPSALPETKLNLVLRGVLAVNDKERAQAIIAQPNGDERSYGLGDALPGGAVLKEIKDTSVILLRNHQYETLSLPKLDLGTEDNTTAAVQSPTQDMSLRQVRDTLLSDPQRLAGLIQTQPYMGQNGQLAGYRIEPGTDRGLFQRYGLQPGDIVTAINGIALTSNASAFEILRNLPSRNNVQVQLLRNGVPQTLSLQIE